VVLEALAVPNEVIAVGKVIEHPGWNLHRLERAFAMVQTVVGFDRRRSFEKRSGYQASPRR
jgi:hypothetical protein